MLSKLIVVKKWDPTNNRQTKNKKSNQKSKSKSNKRHDMKKYDLRIEKRNLTKYL